MSSLTEQVRAIKEKAIDSFSYDEYKKYEKEYEELIKNGWASRRESQFPTIAEEMRILCIGGVNSKRIL